MGNKNNFKLVLERIIDAQELLKVGIERGSLSSIERDILLEKFRASYEVILFDKDTTANPTPIPEQNGPVDDKPKVPSASKADDNIYNEKEPSDKDAVQEVKSTTPGNKLENVLETEVKSQPSYQEDFTLDDESEPKPDAELKQQDYEIGKEEPAPSILDVEVEPEGKQMDNSNGNGNIENVSTTLAEKFQGKKKFRNEMLGGGKKDMASHLKNKPIADLTKAIGINDKFLFTKELFNGNAELYSKSIRQLNSYTDINDALIYIQENFSWDENNEAANQLIDLVRRKLLHD